MCRHRSGLLCYRLMLPLGVVLLTLSALLPGGSMSHASSGGAGAWSPTGAMNVARLNDTATLLPDGQVLVAGGETSAGTVLSSAELYNPATGTWSATGSMGAPRYSQSATLLPNGQVLVAGGWSCQSNNCTVLSSAELYSPATRTWTATGSMTAPRAAHTATLLPSGQVLVAGGCCTLQSQPSNDALTSAELYNPQTGAWTATGSMATGRLNQTATLLGTGQVLVAGGGVYYCVDFDSSGFSPCPGDALSSAEVYDPHTGLWTATGSMTTARLQHTATLLPNGKVLVVAGTLPVGAPGTPRPDCGCTPMSASAELYDPGTGAWTPTANSPVGAQAGQTATLLPTGQVLIAGGWQPSLTCAPILNCPGVPIANAAVYDPWSAAWVSTPSMSAVRSGAVAALLGTGQVLVAGGGGASADVYTPVSLTVSAATLHVAQTIAVTGTAFTAGEPVALYWDGNSTPLMTTTAQAGGSVSARISIPQATAGWHPLVAVGHSSATAAFAYVHVVPFLMAFPRADTAGSHVLMLGAGFGAREPVALYWDKPVQSLGSTTSTAAGSIAIPVTIPPDATSGFHLIYAVGLKSHAVTVGVVIIH